MFGIRYYWMIIGYYLIWWKVTPPELLKNSKFFYILFPKRSLGNFKPLIPLKCILLSSQKFNLLSQMSKIIWLSILFNWRRKFPTYSYKKRLLAKNTGSRKSFFISVQRNLFQAANEAISPNICSSFPGDDQIFQNWGTGTNL